MLFATQFSDVRKSGAVLIFEIQGAIAGPKDAYRVDAVAIPVA
jgi:hypothetical protein